MRRESRKHEKSSLKSVLFISGSVILLVIIAFVIGVMMLSNKIENDATESKLSTAKISGIVPNKITNTQETSSEIGKTVNELSNENKNKIANETVNKNENKKNTVKTSTSTKKAEENRIKEEKKDAKTEVKAETKTEEVKEPVFISPVDGNEIIREFAKDKLVYSETLGEWITHNGIDIKAEKTTVVKVSADGKVSSIKNDPRYGLTVVIDHDDGFQTVYANLLTAEFVTSGEIVKSGQTLGTVGNTATFETLDDSHLHFEIIKNGEYLDPSIYIK